MLHSGRDERFRAGIEVTQQQRPFREPMVGNEMPNRAFHVPRRRRQIEERGIREHVRNAVEQQIHARHRHFLLRIEQQQIVGRFHQAWRLRDHDGVVHVGDHTDFRAAGNGEQVGFDRLAATHLVRHIMHARFERMLGHKIEIACGIGCCEFTGNIALRIHFVIHFRRPHLHGFEGHAVDGDAHLRMRGGDDEHGADASGQASRLAFEWAVHGSADQARVMFGAIADIRFHARIPIEIAYHICRDRHPPVERSGEGTAEQLCQRRLDFDTLMF